MGEGDGDVGEDGRGVGEDRGHDDGPRRRSGATGSKGERAPVGDITICVSRPGGAGLRKEDSPERSPRSSMKMAVQ